MIFETSTIAIVLVCGVFGMLMGIPLLGYFFDLFKKKAPTEVHSAAEKGEVVVPNAPLPADGRTGWTPLQGSPNQ